MPLKTDYRLDVTCLALDCENRGACQLHVVGCTHGAYIPTMKVKHTQKGDHLLCVAYRVEAGNATDLLARDVRGEQDSAWERERD